MSDALIRVKLEPDLKIWTPTGMVDPRTRAAERAVKEYDSNLFLARHEVTGDWCAFMSHNPFTGEHAPFPVVGFGRELPSADDVREALTRADTARHGQRILDEANRTNDALQEPGRRAADDAAGITAEALEWGHRKLGSHPSPRIFVPRSV